MQKIYTYKLIIETSSFGGYQSVIHAPKYHIIAKDKKMKKLLNNLTDYIGNNTNRFLFNRNIDYRFKDMNPIW